MNKLKFLFISLLFVFASTIVFGQTSSTSCSQYTICSSCTPVDSCGWDKTNNVCKHGSSTGSDDGQASVSGGTWIWWTTEATRGNQQGLSCQSIYGAASSTTSTSVCSQYTSCLACTPVYPCGWSKSQQKCLVGDSGGTPASTHTQSSGSDWAWRISDCSTTASSSTTSTSTTPSQQRLFVSQIGTFTNPNNGNVYKLQIYAIYNNGQYLTVNIQDKFGSPEWGITSNNNVATITLWDGTVFSFSDMSATSSALVSPTFGATPLPPIDTSIISISDVKQTTGAFLNLPQIKGLNITYKDNLPAPVTGIFYGIIQNSQGQTVDYTTSEFGTFGYFTSIDFIQLSNLLPSGIYTVKIFAVLLSSGLPISPTFTTTITI